MGAFTTIFTFIFKKTKILDSLHLLALWSSYLISSSISLVIITVPAFKKHLSDIILMHHRKRLVLWFLVLGSVWYFFSPLHHIYKSRTLCWLIHWFSDHLLSNDPASSPGFATVNTLIHLPASSLSTTSCPPSRHPLCRTMSGDYSPSPFVQSLVYTHTLVSSPNSLMQLKTCLNPVSKLCPTNTHTCTRPSYCWFTVTHNSSTTCWKVGWRSVMLCLSVDSDRRKRKKQDFVWDANEAEGPTEGYPDRPQNSP